MIAAEIASMARSWWRFFPAPATMLRVLKSFSGSAGTLISGDRFLPLSATVTLAPGTYSLSTSGFSSADPNGNANNSPFTPPTLNTGGGAITFTGSGFDSNPVLHFVPSAGLPNNQFNAGSFEFRVPEPASGILLAVALLLLLVLVPKYRKRTRDWTAAS